VDPSIAARLRAEFSEAETLAWDRIYAGRTIFFDTRTHQRLRRFSERQVLTVLIFANALAADWGHILHLSSEEKKLWSRYFSSVGKN
jgi:hypothetical protein